jgi:hypothetical protein
MNSSTYLEGIALPLYSSLRGVILVYYYLPHYLARGFGGVRLHVGRQRNAAGRDRRDFVQHRHLGVVRRGGTTAFTLLPMSPRPQKPAKSPFGRVLQELMAQRGIETQTELALRIRKAGYRRCYQSLLSGWFSGSSRPKNALRFCYYLDKALVLTREEKERVAASLDCAEYPRPRQIHQSE